MRQEARNMFEVPPPYRYAAHIEVNMLRIVLLRPAVSVTPLGTGKRVTVGDWHSNLSYFAICNWDYKHFQRLSL